MSHYSKPQYPKLDVRVGDVWRFRRLSTSQDVLIINNIEDQDDHSRWRVLDMTTHKRHTWSIYNDEVELFSLVYRAE